jgi:hypothetical protein
MWNAMRRLQKAVARRHGALVVVTGIEVPVPDGLSTRGARETKWREALNAAVWSIQET